MNTQTTTINSNTKLLTNIFALIVCISLAGCGGGGDSGGGNTSSNIKTDINTSKNDVINQINASGIATLSWIAPTTRTDNTPLALSEISGYKLYMGRDINSLTQYAEINDPSQVKFVINKLDTGTYYFAVTTYSQDGGESDFSTIVSKSI
ncbi:MAG: fibronectin type III domain-containing protein [Gammaproteobacteria bacterium]|nr:fibronectin type III domain-containing protein [Gammaproteobacteria bacterium]